VSVKKQADVAGHEWILFDGYKCCRCGWACGGSEDNEECRKKHAAHLASQVPAQPPAQSDEQIKYMVNRFLSWRLPENFNPDGGISFKLVRNQGTPHEGKNEPVGTNLLDATQAEKMIRYLMDGLPAPVPAQGTQPAQPAGNGVLNKVFNPVPSPPEPTQVGHVWNKERGICSCGEWCRDQAERNYHLAQVYPASELITYEQRKPPAPASPQSETLTNPCPKCGSTKIHKVCEPQTGDTLEQECREIAEAALNEICTEDGELPEEAQPDVWARHFAEFIRTKLRARMAAVRAEALEEAAKLADAHSIGHDHVYGETSEYINPTTCPDRIAQDLRLRAAHPTPAPKEQQDDTKKG
jgi:hypothetical protein